MANIQKITDFLDPRLDAYVRLTGAQLRNRLEPEKGIFIAESPTVIEVALNSGCVPVSILCDERLMGGAVSDIIEKCSARHPDMPVFVAEREVLKNLVGYELTRGALSAMLRPMPRTVEEVCRGARRVAVLEEIADATNVGAIFRSAAALGVDAVLITPTCCDPLSRRALRVSMGTVLQIPWAKIGEHAEDWPKEIERLHTLGFKCAAMALSDNSVAIDDEALTREDKLAIILGTEGTGLKAETIAASDYTVKIPMSHGVDSLNVAAASAVAFWQLRQK
ncbi:MAG: RNA methyltransferase [Clostridia bacterium]|nr:RNA methyltransferase [Clostridia bacterium]